MFRIISLFILLQTNIDYQKFFGDDYIDALNYFESKKSIINAHSKVQSFDKELMVPVLFPERIRYSMVSDLIETAAVEVIYIDFGSDYVDFSIGDFQIKPSFAEKLELAIGESKKLSEKYALLVNYKGKNAIKTRKERVRRLKSLNYQLIYIAAFYDICLQNFNLEGKTKTEKIKFLATAYNFGFDKGQKAIEEHINDRFFPYGTKYKGGQFAYSDVAVDFYLKHYHKLFE